MRNARWLRLLAYVTGSVNQELLARNEYLAVENRILRTKLPSRLRLSDPERVTLAEIGKRLGRKAATLPPWPNRIPSWRGIGDWWPKSSTAPSKGSTQAVLQFQRKSKVWWSGWRERIPAGDMTGSSAPLPTWVITCPIKR
jgi:hypothetical protein